MNINIYNPYVRTEMELYHHGIAGQRWGRRNGPPYPLSAGAHSASEKKAGWRKSLDKSSGSTSTSRSKPPKSSGVKKIKGVGKKKISHFTPEQKAKAKKVAITALKVAGAVAITAAAAYAGYKGGIILSKAIKGGLAKKAAVARVVSNNAGRDYLGKSARLRAMGPGHSIGKKKLTIDAKKAYSTFTNKYEKAMTAKNRYDRYNRFSKYTPLDVGASAGVVAGYALASNASKKKKKNGRK